MDKFRDLLSGKKTYLVMAGAILYAGISYLNGEMTSTQALMYALQSTGVMTMRAGVAKK